VKVPFSQLVQDVKPARGTEAAVKKKADCRHLMVSLGYLRPSRGLSGSNAQDTAIYKLSGLT